MNITLTHGLKMFHSGNLEEFLGKCYVPRVFLGPLGDGGILPTIYPPLKQKENTFTQLIVDIG